MESHKFSKASEDNLKGVHPELQMIMVESLKMSPIDFGISEGVRSKKRQLELLAEGKSLTNKSRHLTGHAVDIFALPNKQISWDFKYYKIIADVVLELSKNKSIAIEWGGNWDKIKDGVHFQLSKEEYP